MSAGPRLPDPAAVAARLAAAAPLRFDLDAAVGFYLLGYVQLALRHPAAGSHAGRLVRAFAFELGDQLAARVPELRDLVDAGWDAGRDVPTP